ncbi:S8 family serine peptidase [Coralloluteibacterium thermophilus]|uniref:S8 family serine peptidase n=1 Tax=Coralloluteibacterium thermophilum TaxID=2707049 RepID=A0ABV9NJI0_9GAMM
MRTGHLLAATVLALLLPAPASGGEGAPLRIVALQRCGDLLAREREVCLRVDGAAPERVRLLLDGRVVPHTVEDGTLRLRLDPALHGSGPLHARSGDRRSNPVWLSMRASATLAAGPDEVEENAFGITTYRDLVAVLTEGGEDAARDLAAHVGAELVGAIPPLRVWQLRLPARDLEAREALLQRLRAAPGVRAVMVEESSPEDGLEGEAGDAGAPDPDLAANRFMQAVETYRRRVPGTGGARVAPAPVRIGVVERAVYWESPDFAGLAAQDDPQRLRLYARAADEADGHGSTVAGIFAAAGAAGGATGFLRALDGHHGGMELIVDRGSDAGLLENVATTVRMVEDGARLINWSWGVHRVGARRVEGGRVDSALRSPEAFAGYEALLRAFFDWLAEAHPDVLVVNSAGNAGTFSGDSDHRLPSALRSPQLLVVGGHERSDEAGRVADPDFATRRASSNLDTRVDITAAACVRAPAAAPGEAGARRCGTSYATALATATVAAMRSIAPELAPAALRDLLRRSALPIGEDLDADADEAEALTAPLRPHERGGRRDDPDVGRSARLDMRGALRLALEAREGGRAPALRRADR